MKKSFLMFLSLTAFSVVAQVAPRIIKGSVTDTSHQPVIGAAVILFDSDSLYQCSAVTDTLGVFRLETSISPFRLLVQHIAYLPKTVGSENFGSGDIILEENVAALDEVVVKALRPVVKMEEGRLSYDLQGLAQNMTVNNAYEAITRLPGIEQKDGKLTLTGAGSLTVIINGKPSTMTAEQITALLQSTPIERISKAEIMYSTPPQYHVRGASLNIVLQRSFDYSFTGQVNLGYENEYYDDYSAGVNLVWSSPLWNADVTYSAADRNGLTRIDLDSRHSLDGVVTDVRQLQNLKSDYDVHNLRAAIEYAPQGGGSISAVYTGEYQPSDNRTTDALGNWVTSHNQKTGDQWMHNAALHYTSTFGLKAGADYTNFRCSMFSQMQNLYQENQSSQFDVSSDQKIDKYSLYIDQQHSLSKGWGLSYGVKGNITRDRDSQFYQLEEGEMDVVNTDSDLREYVADAYAGFSKSWEKGSLSASLTGEYYEMEDYKRWNLYPQASFMWQFDESNMLQASFSSDKTYPSYWEMQNTVSYIDGYSEIYGNINLHPMRDYSTQLVYMFRQKYMLVLFWNEMPDFFVQTAYQSADKLALLYKTFNWDFNRHLGISASVPFAVGDWLKSRISLSGLYIRQKCSEFYDTSFDRSRYLGVGRMQNSIKLSSRPDISLEVSGFFQSNAIQGTYDVDPAWSLDAGVKMNFAKDKASLSVRCEDIFNTSIPYTQIRFHNQDVDMDSGFYSRCVTVNLSYRFGAYKDKDKKEVDTSRFGH